METEKKIIAEGLKEALEKFEGVLKGSEGNPIMVSGEPGTGKGLFIDAAEKLLETEAGFEGRKITIRNYDCGNPKFLEDATKYSSGYYGGGNTQVSYISQSPCKENRFNLFIFEHINYVTPEIEGRFLFVINHLEKLRATVIGTFTQRPGTENDLNSSYIRSKFLQIEVPPLKENFQDHGDTPKKELSENATDIRNILIQMEPNDEVSIQIPGKPEIIGPITELGFNTATTREAKVLKTILNVGEYIANSPADEKLPAEVEKKLQGIIKTQEKLIIRTSRGSGRYVSIFKIKAKVQKERLDRDLERAWKSGNKDLFHELLTKELEGKRITEEEAKILFEDHTGVSVQSAFD